jgi:hypothetical protein
VKMMEVAPVVRAGLKALGRGPSVIPGFINGLAYLAVKLLPRRVATAVAGKLVLRVTATSA